MPPAAVFTAPPPPLPAPAPQQQQQQPQHRAGADLQGSLSRLAGGMAQGAADLTPAAMAATLETLMQLQKQLLSFTAATAASQQQPGPGSGGPRREEAPYQLGGGSGSGRDSFGSRPALSQHGLDETDLRESLEQLRRSQQYTVDAPSYPGGLPNLRQPPPSLVPSFRDEPSGGGFQKSAVDTYSSNAGGGASRPFGLGSSAGQTASSLYGLSGSSSSSSAYSSSSRGGSDASRINEYRRSSLGPTAPVTTDYGRSPPSSSSYGYRRHDSGSSKRY